jgi:hypothetical protein
MRTNRHFFIAVLIIFCSPLISKAQKNEYKGFPSLVWPKLYNVTYVKARDTNGEYEKPVFSAPVKLLAGKAITLPGYIVPFENGLKSSSFMLSSLPLNACFFCGVGGPESVVEVHLKKEITYNEKPIEVKGVLKLNDTNPDKMMYVLENAEIIGEVGL